MSGRGNMKIDGATLALVKRIYAFRNAPESLLEALFADAREIQLETGEKLVSQGEVSLSAMVILSGSVVITNESQHGSTPVATISAPALVGEIGALTGLPRTASIIAGEPLTAYSFGREALQQAVAFAPEILTAVISQLGQQIQTINAALGLYAAGLSGLERDELDLSILDDLKHPTPALASFATAFGALARRITVERRSRDEMSSAILIQRAMLPLEIDAARLKGQGDVKGDMKPARQVGGDFYDMFLLDDERLVIAVGDVCGKGVPASLFMSVTVTTLRLAAKQGEPLPEMIARVNTLLLEQNAASMFSTLFYGVLDLTSGRLEYVNCGHNPPYLFGPGREPVLLEPGGAPLGLLPGRRWTSHDVYLEPEDGVFLFTDGITEAVAADGKEYGEARLVDILRASRTLSAAELVHRCIADVERFAEGAEQFDDMTCLAARFRPVVGAAPAPRA